MICLSKRHEKKETTKTKEVIVPVLGSLIPASHVLLLFPSSTLALQLAHPCVLAVITTHQSAAHPRTHT